MKITKRGERIQPFYVMELLEKAMVLEAGGRDIVHMEIGEPDFTTPERVKEAAIKAIKENHTFYTHSLGLPELRECISEHYLKEYGIDISPERIVITHGTSGAFFLLSAALLEGKGYMGISDPGYPCYRNFACILDADIIPIPVAEDTGFQITPDQISSLRHTPDILIICNPSNPTGIIYSQDNLRGVFKSLKERGGVLIVDEIYSGITYGSKPVSALSISDEIIVVNGFSKTFAMTGWRLGWMVIPEELVRTVQKIAQNVFISPPTISQYAAIEALNAWDEVIRMRDIYQERRDYLLPELRRLGFHIPVDPKGAFYIYAGIERWGMDSMEFVERALKEAGVAITPGYDFGGFKADSHIRFSYANTLDRLKEGCNRLESWLKTL